MTAQPNYGATERAASLRRSFMAMRSALRTIIFQAGECSGVEEPGVPCECPYCVAKTALQGEEEWRFEGYNPSRRKTMPRETAMIDAWRHYFKHGSGPADGTSMPMDAILAKILFARSRGPTTSPSATGTWPRRSCSGSPRTWASASCSTLATRSSRRSRDAT